MASRDETVSRLLSLSESMVEKVMELAETEEEKEEEQQSSFESIVNRGRKLQAKCKQKKAKAIEKTNPKGFKANTVQISCCNMNRKGKSFVKESPMYEVDLQKTDSYDDVVCKIASALDIEFEDCVLMTTRGSIIKDELIEVNERSQSWTLGGYLGKRHLSPDKLTLGISNEAFVTFKKKPPKIAKKDSFDDEEVKILDTEHNVQNETKLQFKTGDEVEVRYCYEYDCIPMKREEVWSHSNGAPGKMDKFGCFNPGLEYKVFTIEVKRGGNRISVLGPSIRKNTKPIIERPKYPIPLVVVSSHDGCKYRWSCPMEKNFEYYYSPVMYVNKPLLYVCDVYVGESCVSTTTFDVQCSPSFDAPDTYVSLKSTSQTSSSCGASDVPATPRVRPLRTVMMGCPQFESLEFSVEEIMKATSDLSTELGCGGFGKVFLAENLRSKGTKAAIKVLNTEGTQALVGNTPSMQVKAELSALMKFRHKNILEIMGYSFSEHFRALVYQYMENDTLFLWTHSPSKCLEWKLRKSIITDMFRGVSYLHAGQLVHQDIKSSNILIDEHFSARVGDFGFAYEVPSSISGRTLVTAPMVARSDGYYPPEIITGKISPLSDVYSCGVVVLEVYTRLVPYDKTRADSDLVTFTEDQRIDKDKFFALANNNGCESTLTEDEAEHFRAIVNGCVQRLSKRWLATQVLDALHFNLST